MYVLLILVCYTNILTFVKRKIKHREVGRILAVAVRGPVLKLL
jgi:ribosomal protein S28E/S33